MEHHFDIEVAKEVGVSAAVIYYNIKYWCETNRANGVNYHDGYYWTFNSVKAFQKLFPYLSDKKISSSLKILEERGYIKSGNYNGTTYDRTKWYADIKVNMETSNLPNGDNHLPKKENGNSQNGEPIPYINHIENNHIKNTNIKEKERKKEMTFDEILDSVSVVAENPDLRETFIDFIKMRKLIKHPLTDRALKGIINDTYKLGKGDPQQMILVLEQSIKASWQGVFPLREEIPTAPSKPTEQSKTYNPFTELKREEGWL